MDIEAAQAGNRESRRWQNQSVGDDDQNIGAPRRKLRSTRLVLQGQRLGHSDSMGQGSSFDRAGGNLTSPPLGAIRLRQNAYDVIASA